MHAILCPLLSKCPAIVRMAPMMPKTQPHTARNANKIGYHKTRINMMKIVTNSKTPMIVIIEPMDACSFASLHESIDMVIEHRSAGRYLNEHPELVAAGSRDDPFKTSSCNLIWSFHGMVSWCN